MEQMMEELTCCICLELFNQPVTLPCAHNFCRGCILQVVGRLLHDHVSVTAECPTCRAPLISGTCHRLPVNKTIQSLADALR